MICSLAFVLGGRDVIEKLQVQGKTLHLLPPGHCLRHEAELRASFGHSIIKLVEFGNTKVGTLAHTMDLK